MSTTDCIPRLIRAATVAAVTASALLCAHSVRAQRQVPERIVAIADIHGDYEAFRGILNTAGLVDSAGAWSGGAAILVQTGDYLDRGQDARRVLDFLRTLEASAPRTGGRTHILFGNHDVMNLLGELRDVSPKAYAAFAAADSEKQRQKAFRAYIALGDARERALGSRPEPYTQRDRDAWLAAHPPGYVEYQAAMQADGDYGRWLRQRQTVIEIGGTVFMHAGIDPAAAPATLDEINRTVKEEIRKYDAARKYMINAGLILPFFSFEETFAAAEAEARGIKAGQVGAPDRRHIETINTILMMGKTALLASDGPLWFRGFSTWSDGEGRPLIQQLLARYGARRFVTGHSIQTPSRIGVRFDHHAFLIDTAMSSVYKDGRASALEIAGERITAIYRDSKVVLVEAADSAAAPR